MSDNNTWPDPARPGVPLNPEREGWHWRRSCKVGRQPVARYWCAPEKVWQDGPTTYVTIGIASQDYYLGPCLTPSEVDARVAQARRDALEEAALRLEELHKNHKYNPKTGEGSEHDVGYYCALSEGAAWIRALKGEGDD